MVAISYMEQRRLETEKIIPIRKAVLGEWKMVEYQNWEGSRSCCSSFELFSENQKFELIDGKLKQSGGGLIDLIEGDCKGVKKLYVEDNHLKTIWSGVSTEDIYIQNGRLHHVQNWNGRVWKRIYEMNDGSRMAPIKLGEQMPANLTINIQQLREKLKSRKKEIFVLVFGILTLTFMTTTIIILDSAGSSKKTIREEILELKSELKSDFRAVFEKLVEDPRKENTTRIVFEVPEIKSIRKDIEGSWKLVDHMNFDGYQKAHDSLNLNFEKFSEHLRFDVLLDGRLVQTGGGSEQLIEDFPKAKNFDFYEEDNHIKSYRTDRSTEDRYIKDGKLIRMDFFEGEVTKRVYERI